MKGFFKFLCFMIALAMLVAALASLYVAQSFVKPGSSEETGASFVVDRGMGIREIAAQLHARSFISNPHVFVAAALMRGDNRRLQAGEYLIEPRSSMQHILYKMATGEVYRRQFTIPEGLTSYEIVEILKAVEHLSGDIADIPAEGTLLPETYDFVSGDTRAEKILRMQKAMEKTITDVWPNRATDLPFTTQAEAVTLASIVEKETGVASERRAVAGVFVNRLKLGMPLQSDPTAIYAITQGKHARDGQGPLGRRLLRKDLEIDSQYNTYKYTGLPPGPIANPGKASLEAVLNPEKHEYLYFVADGKGGHAFAKNLADHNRNVAAWRKLRSE